MTPHILTVQTTGGIPGVYRVVSVPALFDLDLVSGDCAGKAGGPAIRLSRNAADGIAGLCLGRLRALPCVVRAAAAAPLEVRS